MAERRQGDRRRRSERRQGDRRWEQRALRGIRGCVRVFRAGVWAFGIGFAGIISLRGSWQEVIHAFIK
jgi:hypothetical protein